MVSTKLGLDNNYSIGAALSFIIMLLGFGLPVWWTTTTVERASLPSMEINNLPVDVASSSRQDFQVLYKSLLDISDHSVTQRLQALEKELNSGYDLTSTFKINYQKMTSQEKQIVQTGRTIEAIDNLLAQEVPEESFQGAAVAIYEISSSILQNKQVMIGRNDFLYINEDTEIASLCKAVKVMLVPHLLPDSVPTEGKLPVSPSYNILLTLASSNTTNTASTSNLVQSISGYLNAFSRKLASIANITITTQVVYIGRGYNNLNLDGATNRYLIDEDKVASLINILEPKLGSQLSAEPTFHWVLYEPNIEQSPMEITKHNSDPFPANTVLSPRWNGGGLQIIREQDSISYCAGLIISQLRQSLGFYQHKSFGEDDVSLLDFDNSGLHKWEKNYLLRQRTIQFLNQASATLKSLNKLLLKIENIVVSDEIREYIVTSVASSHSSRLALEGNQLLEACRSAQMSFTSAEKAFFDPSLLEKLYFPDDQKYAIYIPLFLPVGIPVLLSLRSVFKFFL